jgi:hypothetical protein
MRRRSVLVSGLTGTLASAFAVGRTTLAQEATPTTMAGHPFVGTWVVFDPADPTGMPTTNIITADGGLIALFAEGGGTVTDMTILDIRRGSGDRCGYGIVVAGPGPSTVLMRDNTVRGQGIRASPSWEPRPRSSQTA